MKPFHFPLRITMAAMKLFGFADDPSQKRTAASDWTNGSHAKCRASNCLEGARQPPWVDRDML
jgi:hypothetical protein